MRILRPVFFTTALIIVIFALTSLVYATPPPPPEQSVAIKEQGIESLNFLIDWNCDIISSGNGNINLSGYTQANRSVDYIMVRLFLQRWDGNRWVDQGSWLFERHSSSKVEGTKSLQVTKGYYYRTRGVHGVTHNGINEPATSYSTSVLIK